MLQATSSSNVTMKKSLSDLKAVSHGFSMGDYLRVQMYIVDTTTHTTASASNVIVNSDPINLSQPPASPMLSGGVEIGTTLTSLTRLGGEEFVTNAYKAILNRSPDPSGLVYYLNRLTSGQTKYSILADLRFSKEGRSRRAKIRGLSTVAWLSRIRRTPPLKQVIDFCVFPWYVVNSFRKLHEIELTAKRNNFQQQLESQALMEAMSLGHERLSVLVRDLSSQFDRKIIEVEALLDKRHDDSIRNSTIENKNLHRQFTVLQVELTNQFQRLSSTCEASIPNSIELAKNAILDRLSRSDDLQAKLLLRQQQLIDAAVDLLCKKQTGAEQDLRTIIFSATSSLHTDLAAKVHQTAAQLGRDLQRGFAVANDAHLDRLASSMRAQLQQQLAQYSEKIAALVTKQNAKLASNTNSFNALYLASLTSLEGNIVRYLQDTSSQPGGEFPRIIAEAKDEILGLLSKTQSQQIEISRLIEEYASNTVAQFALKRSEMSREFSAASDAIKTEIVNLKGDIANDVRQTVDHLSLLFPQALDVTKLAIFDRLSENEKLQAHLHAQADRSSSITAELFAKQISKGALELGTTVTTIQTALANMESALVSQTIPPSSQFSDDLPDRLEALKNAIFSNLSISEHLQTRIENWLPLFDRIELYSLAAARRVAIRCGSNAVMVRTDAGYLLCPDDDHALIAALVEIGDYEPGTRSLIQRLLIPGDVFLDVGANIGVHTVTAARAMQGRGRVVSFEPYVATAKLLEKSVWINGFSTITEVHSVAVTDRNDVRELFLGATSGHHSLFPLNQLKGSKEAKVDVKTTTIDSIMCDNLSATLMKIDAEGAELDVLAGAANLLEFNADIGLIVEFGPSHLVRTGVTISEWFEKFSSLGFIFRVIDADDGSLKSIPVQNLQNSDSHNIFFARRKSPLWEKLGVVF
jgi:FkbM family methyltransferase